MGARACSRSRPPRTRRAPPSGSAPRPRPAPCAGRRAPRSRHPGIASRSARTTPAPWRSPDGSPAETKMRGAGAGDHPAAGRGERRGPHRVRHPKRQGERRPSLLAAAPPLRGRRGPRARSSGARAASASASGASQHHALDDVGQLGAGARPPVAPEPHELARRRSPGRARGTRWAGRGAAGGSARGRPARRWPAPPPRWRTRPAHWPCRDGSESTARPEARTSVASAPPVRCSTRSRSWIIRSSTTATSVPRGWNGASRWLSM